MTLVYRGDGIEIRVETEMIEVTTMGSSELDPDWKFTDAAGHDHRVTGKDKLPTLVWVSKPISWYCPDCREHHEDDYGWYECRKCRKRVDPGIRFVAPGVKFVPGPTSYYINNEPVTKEQADAAILGLTEGQSVPHTG